MSAITGRCQKCGEVGSLKLTLVYTNGVADKSKLMCQTCRRRQPAAQTKGEVRK